MCFELNAEPPIASSTEGTTRGEDIVLNSADGTRFAAYAAHTSSPRGSGVVILPDVRGLFHFYKELALRFADAGSEAVAIDYFGRTAGLTARDDSFE
ncbi:MAG: dienelactone hydrolase family protein, partial [Ktedonobacteraceae bacterium]